MTDKQIKVMVVYHEDAETLNSEDQFKYRAYAALWEEIQSVFINDEDLIPINPAKN